MSDRQYHIDRFYGLMKDLEYIFPKRRLKYSHGRMKWPDQGVYFFFEETEVRQNNTSRVVRLGTHAISSGSKATLWKRLRTHRGTQKGTGNHRSSVFRELIGRALIIYNELNYPFWEEKKENISESVKEAEIPLEIQVSEIIGSMPFLCLQVIGNSHKDNFRAYIETNSIALLSNINKDQVIDPASKTWLGLYSGDTEVIESGLWNSNDTEKNYDPSFLDTIEEMIWIMTKDLKKV